MSGWPHARAGLVTFAILIGLMDGCPIPPRNETPPALRDVVAALGRTRRVAMMPFRPIGSLFRLEQTWKLFPTARVARHWMWIEVWSARRQVWDLVYRPNDPDHDLWEDQLTYRRLRGGWNPGKDSRSGYAPFVAWVAHRIFAERGDVHRVRVRMERIRIDAEGDGFDELGRFDDERIERRGRSRPMRRPQRTLHGRPPPERTP